MKEINLQIHRWDATMNDNAIPHPMIYISPTINLLEFAKLNDFYFPVVIKGSESNYDGVTLNATLDKSAYIPACQPNFYDKTGWYVLTLDCKFLGFPKNLGSVSIPVESEQPVNNSLKMPTKLQSVSPNYATVSNSNDVEKTDKTAGLTAGSAIGLTISVLAVLSVLIALAIRSKKV